LRGPSRRVSQEGESRLYDRYLYRNLTKDHIYLGVLAEILLIVVFFLFEYWQFTRLIYKITALNKMHTSQMNYIVQYSTLVSDAFRYQLIPR